MKTLKKTKLHDFPTLDDQEMKRIAGGFGGGTPPDYCPRGDSEIRCVQSCLIEATDTEGNTRVIYGECHYSGIANICACVKPPGYS